MGSQTEEEYFAGMLQHLVREAHGRLGPRGDMLCYLLEMALMEAEELRRTQSRNEPEQQD